MRQMCFKDHIKLLGFGRKQKSLTFARGIVVFYDFGGRRTGNNSEN